MVCCTSIIPRIAKGEKLSNHLVFVVGLGVEELSLPNPLGVLALLARAQSCDDAKGNRRTSATPSHVEMQLHGPALCPSS